LIVQRLHFGEIVAVSHEISAAVERPATMAGYELLDKIGEGGMGQVHRATQLSLGRTVAIKFLNPLSPEWGERSVLHRESRLMASLAHPHIVTIYDCGQAEGRPYLVMEYVDGATLRSRMTPGQPWSVATAAPLLDAIAQALAYIHEQGILHLDLKPENVLCTTNGGVKITDFGLAASHLDARTLLEMGFACGSLDYCSPEQRHGLPLDPRSDVFSLAVLAYELLTGQLPSRVYTPASKLNRALPRAVDDVLRRGLERQAEARPACVEAFRQGLLRALGWRKPVSRRRQLALALGFGVILGGLALTLLRPNRIENAEWTRLEDDDSPRSAPFGGGDCLLYPSDRTGSCNLFLLRPQGGPTVNLTTSDNQDVFPTCSPDGRWIAFTSDRNGKNDIYLMDSEGGQVKQLTHGDGSNQAPCWSPDGKRLAFTSNRDKNYEIYLMNADGSHPINLTRSPSHDADPAWSPDGKKIAFASRRGKKGFRVYIMDADGANVRAVSPANNSWGYVYPAWSPDGTKIASGGRAGQDVELFICDADGSHQRQLTHLEGMNSLAVWSRDGQRIVFQHTRRGARVGSLCQINADGSGLITILKSAGPREGGRATWRLSKP
jgi:serine/threonine protein kinase